MPRSGCLFLLLLVVVEVGSHTRVVGIRGSACINSGRGAMITRLAV